jgi:hypothetical protein
LTSNVTAENEGRKEAKDFYFLALRHRPGHGLDLGSGGRIKVFWFFSSEKNIFPNKDQFWPIWK